MSWNARRFIPGKPVLRAIRHRKKILSRAESRALSHREPDNHEISTALMYAADHGLDRLMAIINLAANFTSLNDTYERLKLDYADLENECASWKFKWLMERSKVVNLEAKVGAMRKTRQQARTRMRAGKHVTRFVRSWVRR